MMSSLNSSATISTHRKRASAPTSCVDTNSCSNTIAPDASLKPTSLSTCAFRVIGSTPVWSRNCNGTPPDRKSTRLNSSHVEISYAVFCLKKKKDKNKQHSQRAQQQE